MLLAVVVIVAGVVVLRGTRSSTAVTGPRAKLTLSITPRVVACPVDVEWSPDGTRIAMLGYPGWCPGTNPSQAITSGELDIYDATSGQLIASSNLDANILPKGNITLGQPTTDPTTHSVFDPFIAYTGLIWSPNSKYLAVPFVVLNQPYFWFSPDRGTTGVPLSTPTWAGVWLTGYATDSAGLGFGQALTTKTTLDLNQMQRPAMEWDLTEGNLFPGSVSLPPALAYTWHADGTLSAIGPLAANQAPPAAGTLGSVGSPSGSQVVSIWQSGEVSQGQIIPPPPSTPTNSLPTPTPVPNLHMWYTNYALWSPDGRYLITPAYYGGRVAIPGESTPSLTDLKATGQDQAAVLPARGAAMRQVLRQYPEGGWLAWRPDGKVLAALVGTGHGFGIVLYDCASGAQLTTFTFKQPSSPIFDINTYGLGPDPDSIYLRWSPNGKRLLLFNGFDTARLDVWNFSGL